MFVQRLLSAALVVLGAAAIGGTALENLALNPVTALPAPKHATLRLVEGGRAMFRIVGEGKPARGAAAVLRDAFARAGVELDTGGDLEISLEAGGNPENGAFEVVTSARGIRISGNALWGVYDFAERFLGARYYCIGDEGEVHPPVRTLEVEPMAYRDSPRMVNRGVYIMQAAIKRKEVENTLGRVVDESELQRWRNSLRVVDADGFRIMHEPAPVPWTKAHTNLIPRLIETSFFANAQGRRYQSFDSHAGNYFDVTSFDFVENLIATYKRFYSLKNPHSRRASGFRYLNDKYVVFGQCDCERQLWEMQSHPVVKENGLITEKNIALGSEGYFSDVYGRFYKRLAERLAEELPGKKLVVMPYLKYTRAPTQERFFLPDNVEVGLCLRSLPKFVHNKKCLEESRQILSEWSRALHGRPVQQAWGYAAGNNFFTEAVAFNYEGEFINAMGALLGDRGIFQEVHPSNGAFSGDSIQIMFHYEMYVLMRQVWNPDFNVRAALDEYFRLMYGPAGEKLIAFYGKLVEAYERYVVPEAKANALYPVPVLDALESDLNSAKVLLRGDTVEARRFELFERPFRYQIEAQRGRHAFVVPRTLAHFTDDEISVDGRGNEFAWHMVEPVGMFRPDGINEPPHAAPTVKFVWSNDGIYGLVVQTNAAEKAKPALWQNDTVELFVSPGLGKTKYFQLAFDRSGHVHRLKHVLKPIPLASDMSWPCDGLKHEQVDVGRGWSLEFFVPFSAFESDTPKPYDNWNYLVTYTKQTDPREMISTSVTLRNNHEPDRYGVMKFMGREVSLGGVAPYSSPNRYHGYREGDVLYDESAQLVNNVNSYGISLLTWRAGRQGETETFFFLTDPRRYGGFGQASVKFLSLVVDGIPLSKTIQSSHAMKCSRDGAPAWHLNFDGAAIVVEARQRKDDPLLYLTFRKDPASVRSFGKAEILFQCVVSCYDDKNRYSRFAKTATRAFGMSRDWKDWTALLPTDRYLMLADRILDGSKNGLGFGPSLFRFQNDWRGVESIRFAAPKTSNAQLRIVIDPDTFDSFTVGILQLSARIANGEFEKLHLKRIDKECMHRKR